MKKKEDFIVREIAGDIIMMPVGETAAKFNGLVMANEVSAFIWENIENVNNAEDMTKLVFDEFEVDFDEAKKDVEYIMGELVKAGWIE